MINENESVGRLGRGILIAVMALLVIPLLVPAGADARFLHLYDSYRWNYVIRHMEFGQAHSVMTDRVVFDEQGFIDLAMCDLHPLAVRDLFPYPWLYRDDQLRAMNYNPILFWSIPTYLPSYDEYRRIYTLGGGYFFDPWFSFHGGIWERAWAGYYGKFPYDMYWGWWQYNFYFVDYPYGSWWLSGSGVMARLSEHVDSVEVKRRAGWPVGLWVREPLPSALAAAVPAGAGVMETLVATGRWQGVPLVTGDQPARRVAKEDQPRITRSTAPRGFLPRPGPEREGRRTIRGDVSQGGSSSGGSLGSSGTSSGIGAKRKSKKK